MSIQNHGQPIPSHQGADQGETPPVGVAVPTPPSDDAPEETPETTPVALGDGWEPGGDTHQATAEETAEQPLPSSRGEGMEDKVSKLEQQCRQQQQQLEEKDKQLEKKDNQIKTLAADYANLQRRNEGDQHKYKLQYARETLDEILPIVDTFARADKVLSPEKLETLCAQDVHENFQGIHRKFITALEQLDVSRMNVEGQPFDPSLHEAVTQAPSHEYEEGVVTEELECGFLLNEGKEGQEVLRPAKVKVSMGPGPTTVLPSPGEPAENRELNLEGRQEETSERESG